MTNLVGYLLFAVWLIPLGRRGVSSRRAIEFFWAGMTCIMLIGQFGWLIPLLELGHDGDYQAFVWGFGLTRSQSAAVLMVVLAANGAMIWSMVSHFRRVRRQE